MKNLTLEQQVKLLEKLKDGKRKAKLLDDLRKEMEMIKSLYIAERDPEIAKSLSINFEKIKTTLESISVKEQKDIAINNFPKSFSIDNLKDYPKVIEVSNQPEEIRVSNLKEFPKKIEMTNPSLLVGVKKNLAELKIISKILGGIKSIKAVVSGEVFITNRDARDAIPVVLTDQTRKFFYNAIQQVLGGRGSSGLVNKSGTEINPATEETAQAILAAVGGSPAETSVFIYNEAMALKNTTYSKLLPDNTTQLSVKLADIGYDLKVSWVAGFTTYFTIPPGSTKTLQGVNFVGKTLYFQSDGDSQVVQIEVITQ